MVLQTIHNLTLNKKNSSKNNNVYLFIYQISLLSLFSSVNWIYLEITVFRSMEIRSVFFFPPLFILTFLFPLCMGLPFNICGSVYTPFSDIYRVSPPPKHIHILNNCKLRFYDKFYYLKNVKILCIHFLGVRHPVYMFVRIYMYGNFSLSLYRTKCNELHGQQNSES